MTSTNNTHSMIVGYILWIFGFIGSHRFYFGRPVSGTIYFFTLGLFLIGWIVDLFLIPGMDRDADLRYASGSRDYTVSWWSSFSWSAPCSTYTSIAVKKAMPPIRAGMSAMPC